jgi:hypothetical protein
MRSVNNWNRGKQEEFKDRKMFTETGGIVTIAGVKPKVQEKAA